MTPNTVQDVKAQRGLFDLQTMDEVTLVKVGKFTPVSTIQEASERVGNDSAKLIDIVNRGLRSEFQTNLTHDSNVPWMVEDEEGKLVAFTGTPADQKTVNNLILSLAKSVFGYSKESDIEQKRAAKESAKTFIRTNDAIRAGLQKQAAAAETDNSAE